MSADPFHKGVKNRAGMLILREDGQERSLAMTRKIIDHAEPQAEGKRVAEFVKMDRESGVHPAVQELSKRAPERSDENRKAVEYARIERGKEA